MKIELNIDELRDPESFLLKKIKILMDENEELKGRVEVYEQRVHEAMVLLNSVAQVYEEEEEEDLLEYV